jgi:HlyD family secretion protein
MAQAAPADEGEKKPQDAPATKEAPAKDAAPAKEDAAKKEEKKDEKPADKKDEKPAKPEEKAEKKEEKPQQDVKPAQPAQPAQPATPPAPPHYVVKRDAIKIQVDLDGVFEASSMSEIILRMKEWQGLVVVEAVEHGASVKKGDVLVKFEMDKIDRAIEDMRREMKLADLSMKQAEEQFALLEKFTPLDLENSKRDKAEAEEDYKFYQEVSKPITLKNQEMRSKSMHNQLEYMREELAQLEKMYKADDLTEETEKLVLKRQRDQVENAEWSIHVMDIQAERLLKVELPRRQREIEENYQRSMMLWSKQHADLARNLTRARIEMEKMKVQAARNDEKMAKILADREMMASVKAPCDGIVYYGRSQNGRFSDAMGMAESFKRYGNLPANQVFMTIVESGPLCVRTTVPEGQLHNISKGIEGKVIPTAFPDLKWDAEVEKISELPTSPGAFAATVSFSPDKPAKQVVAGMSCKIKLVPYTKADAIVVPPKLVLADSDDEDEKYVYVLDKNNKAEKREVKVGRQTDKVAEIRKGLKEGDRVLLEAPKDEK